MEIYEELQKRNLIAQTTNEEEIRRLVNSGQAVFYIGFDPTADSLHVGHFMALCLMKRLQMAGNRPIVLIGGGTGYVGDPSGRTDMRSMMTPEVIEHNCACFKKQMEKFIEFGEGKAIMVNNADWLLKLNYVELLREVGACFSVNNMLRAECYKQRMEKGLSFLEFNYMIMQSYDFLELYRRYGCNLQFGGDDQWSNMLGGRELIRRKLDKEANAMTITLLLNSEGKKMGKTVGGAVWLDPEKTSPYDFYQYWRNVGDNDVLKCIRMLTFIPLEEIDKMDAWEGSQLNTAKEILAFELTKLVHGEEAALQAQATAKNLFAAGGSDAPEALIPADKLTDGKIDILGLLVASGLVSSRSDARRAVEQGGVTADGEKVTDLKKAFDADALKAGVLVKKGKKNFKKCVLA
ncbi:MAG: tyrosine--tRNA ligase [Clostridia bacterium]|nr:tyrosine--tRNA ligase [Clostridia bacterium]